MPEPDKIVKFDAELTMDQTRDACVVEQNAGYQLQSLEHKTIFHGGVALMVNRAEFIANLDWLPELLFVAPGPNDPNAIKTQKAAQGWEFLFSGAIYVEGSIENMMVFAK